MHSDTKTDLVIIVEPTTWCYYTGYMRSVSIFEYLNFMFSLN